MEKRPLTPHQEMPPVVDIKRGSALFPEKISTVFGVKTPDIIQAVGNINLLQKSGIGFCGSRQSSPKGLAVACECVKQLITSGIVTISGYAKGVDMAAHTAALEHGGETIIILPEGLQNFKIKKEIAPFWDWERVLVLSQFQADAPWTVWRAMERNSLIIGLSKAMVVIEAGTTGGTFNAGQTTLKANHPLFVIKYADMTSTPGNEKLIQMGGHPISKSRATQLPNLSHILATIEPKREIPSQFNLF